MKSEITLKAKLLNITLMHYKTIQPIMAEVKLQIEGTLKEKEESVLDCIRNSSLNPEKEMEMFKNVRESIHELKKAGIIFDTTFTIKLTERYRLQAEAE